MQPYELSSQESFALFFLNRFREHVVERRFARTADDDDEREADGEQMIFKAFAFLCAEPVHEKPIRRMNGCNGDDHVRGDAEGGDAAQAAENQADGTGKFRRDCQKRQWCGNVHLLREKIHRAAEAVAAEPAERFLRAVREHHDAECQPRDERRETVVGFAEELECFHGLFVGWLRLEIISSISTRNWRRAGILVLVIVRL